MRRTGGGRERERIRENKREREREGERGSEVAYKRRKRGRET